MQENQYGSFINYSQEINLILKIKQIMAMKSEYVKSKSFGGWFQKMRGVLLFSTWPQGST